MNVMNVMDVIDHGCVRWMMNEICHDEMDVMDGCHRWMSWKDVANGCHGCDDF